MLAHLAAQAVVHPHCQQQVHLELQAKATLAALETII
jgi:hypothetical protein